MSYVTREAREQLLETIAEATERIGAGLAALGVAYEQLPDANADRLEEELFRPVQLAYGRLQRTHAGFAERHGLAGRAFEPSVGSSRPHQARELVEDAVEAVVDGDYMLTDLQDSMMPVEVGDPELRAGLAEVRELIGGLESRAGAFLSTLGR